MNTSLSLLVCDFLICFLCLIFPTGPAKPWIFAQNALQVSSCSVVCLFGWLISCLTLVGVSLGRRGWGVVKRLSHLLQLCCRGLEVIRNGDRSLRKKLWGKVQCYNHSTITLFTAQVSSFRYISFCSKDIYIYPIWTDELSVPLSSSVRWWIFFLIPSSLETFKRWGFEVSPNNFVPSHSGFSLSSESVPELRVEICPFYIRFKQYCVSALQFLCEIKHNLKLHLSSLCARHTCLACCLI